MRPWTGSRRTARSWPHQASMGPRPCGRGRRRSCGRRRCGPCASMGPRPCGRGRVCGTFWTWRKPTCFNGATALRPWTAITRRATAARAPCFNGATALRPWTAALRLPPLPRQGASMGPRPCGRGRRIPGSSQRQGGPASMGPRPCGRGRRRWGRRGLPACCASMGPRPCGRGRQVLYECPGKGAELQWGHGLAAVDGGPPPAVPSSSMSFNGATALRPWTAGPRILHTRRRHRASMGPRPCGRGRHEQRNDRTDARRGFNGATALRPWTDTMVGKQRHRSLASMGPRPCGRGRVHRRASADRGPGASMGPRPCGRGRRRPDCAPGRTAQASMGPRPCGRGRHCAPAKS